MKLELWNKKENRLATCEEIGHLVIKPGLPLCSDGCNIGMDGLQPWGLFEIVWSFSGHCLQSLESAGFEMRRL